MRVSAWARSGASRSLLAASPPVPPSRRGGFAERGLPALSPFARRPPAARVDGVGDLPALPPELLRHHRALNQRVASPLESPLAERCPEGREVGAAGRRRRARRSQCRARLDRSVAVGTPDLDRRA